MSRYRVGTPYVMWTYVTVEAEDESEAIDKSADVQPPALSANASGWGEEWAREVADEPLYIEDSVKHYAIEPYAEKIED